MDTDIDLDAELMNKLNAMGTRDHEDLVAQFQSIVGSQISPAGCAFYLEMANWYAMFLFFACLVQQTFHMIFVQILSMITL